MCKITQIELSIVEEKIDGRLCAAARALLGWSQDELCKQSGISRKTLSDFETQTRRPHVRIIRDVIRALSSEGVIFAKAPGGKMGVLK